MAKAIAGFFRTKVEGERAKAALEQAGYAQNEVSYLVGNLRANEVPKIGPPVEESGSESEAASDAFMGGVVGLAAGAILMVLPGIGPLLAAGPIAGAIGGLTAGVAVGGLVGLIKDHGVSEEEAQFYAEGVRRGGALLIIHGVDEDREKAGRKILDDAGAMTTEELAEEYPRANMSAPPTKTLRAG